ncbi:hypothetical protein BHE74_00000180 [Ensete ventricosum]|nr:hypothetical protein BHE74_00000180 [Ensete ventricosum]
MPQRQVINASVSPKGSLETLSQREVQQLSEAGTGSIYTLFRQCALAILNTGAHIDNAKTILDAYKDFEVRIHQQDRGVRLELLNAPADAFVDGEMIASTREMLFSALRDIVYTENELDSQRIDLSNSQGITDYVFHLLRNARTLRPGVEPKIVVCWGGHSINTEEYKYTKKVGHELGLRSLDVCTGCGPGVMKGPMKGATISHAKQRITGGRYLGLTEPGIIAAEAPNPIVNELVILPDIEKRLEAFVRVGHGIIIFPGGAGTAEEFLYLLGILMHPDNRDLPFPVILTGPKHAAPYLQQLHAFVGATLGEAAQAHYQIIIDDPAEVARQMTAGLKAVKQFRRERNDAFHFNWLLKIDEGFQRPFDPTHANMAALQLSHSLPPHELAANLRRAFSGIVAGNVKDKGIRLIEQNGPYEIHGDPAIMKPLDELLQAFVAQHRMKLPGGAAYVPCAMPAWKQAVFHFTKNRHVLAHVDVVSGHVHHIVEAASALLQHHSQVLPGGDELRLWVVDHSQFWCATDLPGAVKGVADLYCRDVTGALDNRVHGGRDDEVAVGHGLSLFTVVYRRVDGVMVAVIALYPVRMHVTITFAHLLPVTVYRDVSPTFPTPVAARPDITVTGCGLDFDHLDRWRLRSNDFNILPLHRPTLMHNTLLHTPGRRDDDRRQCRIT